MLSKPWVNDPDADPSGNLAKLHTLIDIFGPRTGSIEVQIATNHAGMCLASKKAPPPQAATHSTAPIALHIANAWNPISDAPAM